MSATGQQHGRPDSGSDLGPPAADAARAGIDKRVLIEVVLAGLVLASVAFVAWRFAVTGHLPHPFQSDPNRTLMDLYNTAFWANRDGAYAIWHTVYPPLSFVFLRIFTLPQCYTVSAVIARGCDWHALVPIFTCYVANIALVYLSYRKADARTAVPRTIAIVAGIPMLYGLELANLLIPCFTCFVLGHGGLIRSTRLASLFEALAINFKLYLIVAALPRLVERRWRALLYLAAALTLVYLATYLLQGSGSPVDIVRDLFVYANREGDWYARVNNLAAFSERSHDLWNQLFTVPIRFGQAFVVLCFALALVAPAGVNARRLASLILTVVSTEAALSTQGHSADYTQIFLLFVLFFERWRDVPRAIVLSCAYLLCLSADTIVVPVDQSGYFSFLGQRTVIVAHGLSIGQFARPALLLIIQFVLLGLVVADLKIAQPVCRGLKRSFADAACRVRTAVGSGLHREPGGMLRPLPLRDRDFDGPVE